MPRWTSTSAVHFGIGERPGLEKLRQQIELLPADSHWQTLAKVALAGDLNDLQQFHRPGRGARPSRHGGREARVVGGAQRSRFRAGEAPAG